MGHPRSWEGRPCPAHHPAGCLGALWVLTPRWQHPPAPACTARCAQWAGARSPSAPTHAPARKSPGGRVSQSVPLTGKEGPVARRSGPNLPSAGTYAHRRTFRPALSSAARLLYAVPRGAVPGGLDATLRAHGGRCFPCQHPLGTAGDVLGSVPIRPCPSPPFQCPQLRACCFKLGHGRPHVRHVTTL